VDDTVSVVTTTTFIWNMMDDKFMPSVLPSLLGFAQHWRCIMNERLKKVVAVNTRMFQGDDATRTNLTIDASALSEEEMFEYVIDSAVIKWQSAIRRKKDSVIPREATYIVPKRGHGVSLP
jgi:hypothetical protein